MKDPIDSKICIYNKGTERVNCFKCLGYYTTCENEKYISYKFLNYNRVMVIIDHMFKPDLIQIHTGIRLYKTSARSMLIYGSEDWTVSKRKESSIRVADMKFVRRTADYTCLNCGREFRHNEEIKYSSICGIHIKLQI
jgi:hypothetical protein